MQVTQSWALSFNTTSPMKSRTRKPTTNCGWTLPRNSAWTARQWQVPRHMQPPGISSARSIGSLPEILEGALATLYAYESQQPEVSRRKADGLRQYYGVESARSIAYFEVHAETDIRHREGERDALRRCLDAGSSPEIVLDSADQALNAYWGLLDGICEDAGLTSTCLS